MPALVVATQALGEPRYPSLKGIMAARSKTLETKTLGDVAATTRRSRGAAVGGAVATVGGRSGRRRRRRAAATRVDSRAGRRGRAQVVEFLAERRII